MKNTYQNPLVTRYASKEMSYIFSPDFKFSTWRKLWLALATAEKELGLEISEIQIDEMKAHLDDIDYDLAREKEKIFRHDVMAHVHTFGEVCPNAKPIIHLGATSCFVGDNTDLIQIKDASKLIAQKCANVLDLMAKFAEKYKNLPTLGYTHYQPAQMTTVGKRVSLWMYELCLDLELLESFISNIKMRGAKGTTGTQASYLELFDGDYQKVNQLDKRVAELMSFSETVPVSGQTYSRKVDSQILNILSGIGQTMHKMTNDIRLLQNLKEIEEPFEKTQIGSSAMAYKRNPMRSERISSISKYLISNQTNGAMVASTQWFERTLDDSANRRLSLGQSFMAADAVLDIAANIFDGMVVYENVIKKHVNEELPFMATENILMQAVKKGGDRQELHEEIRTLSMQAAEQVKVFGKNNDLLDRIVNSSQFDLTKEDLDKILDHNLYIGCSAKQVDEFIKNYIEPIRCNYKDSLGKKVTLSV